MIIKGNNRGMKAVLILIYDFVLYITEIVLKA